MNRFFGSRYFPGKSEQLSKPQVILTIFLFFSLFVQKQRMTAQTPTVTIFVKIIREDSEKCEKSMKDFKYSQIFLRLQKIKNKKFNFKNCKFFVIMF